MAERKEKKNAFCRKCSKQVGVVLVTYPDYSDANLTSVVVECSCGAFNEFGSYRHYTDKELEAMSSLPAV